MSDKTYIMLQPTNIDSRLWMDFASPAKAVSALTERFELRLSELNPQVGKVTYQLADLYSWLDHMAQVFLLVNQRGAGTYVQRDRSWIKEQIAYQLQSEAGR